MNTKAPRFSPAVRERAVRLVRECQADYTSLWGHVVMATGVGVSKDTTLGCAASAVN